MGLRLLETLFPGTPDVISVHIGVFGVGSIVNWVFKSKIWLIHMFTLKGGIWPPYGGVSRLIVIIATSSKHGELLAV